MKISEVEKSKKEKDEIINQLKEIYYNLFVECSDEEYKWDYKEDFKNLLEIISMMK